MRIVLTTSATYRAGAATYRKGVPAVVADDEAARLLATGLFDVAPAKGQSAAEDEREPNSEATVDLTKLKKDELIALATQLGVPTEGTKADLIAAIQAFESALLDADDVDPERATVTPNDGQDGERTASDSAPDDSAPEGGEQPNVSTTPAA